MSRERWRRCHGEVEDLASVAEFDPERAKRADCNPRSNEEAKPMSHNIHFDTAKMDDTSKAIVMGFTIEQRAELRG